jgi:hypothetical protein
VALLPTGDRGPEESDLIEGEGNVVRRVPMCSSFVDDESRQIAWFAQRDALLQGWDDGSRPYAWWLYESGLGERPHGSEARWLAEHDLLEPDEAAKLVAWGRLEIEDRHTRTPRRDLVDVAAIVAERRGIPFEIPNDLAAKIHANIPSCGSSS